MSWLTFAGWGDKVIHCVMVKGRDERPLCHGEGGESKDLVMLIGVR